MIEIAAILSGAEREEMVGLASETSADTYFGHTANW